MTTKKQAALLEVLYKSRKPLTPKQINTRMERTGEVVWIWYNIIKTAVNNGTVGRIWQDETDTGPSIYRYYIPEEGKEILKSHRIKNRQKKKGIKF